jgi:hypothetical protein
LIHSKLLVAASTGALLLTASLNAPVAAYTGNKGCSTEHVDHDQTQANQPDGWHVQFKDKDCKEQGESDVSFSQDSGPQSTASLPRTGGLAITFHAFFIPEDASAASFCTATMNPTSGRTDANGNITTMITLPPNCPGQYGFSATDGQLTVSTTIREIGGFPNTTSNPPSPAPGSPLLPLGLAGLGLLVAGTGLYSLRRRRT